MMAAPRFVSYQGVPVSARWNDECERAKRWAGWPPGACNPIAESAADLVATAQLDSCPSRPPRRARAGPHKLTPTGPGTWRAEPSQTSITAACVAGQARTLVLDEVMQNLRAAALLPLFADSFFVLSPEYTPLWGEWKTRPSPNSSSSRLLDVARQLGATSLAIADDASLLRGPLVPNVSHRHIQRTLFLRFGVCLEEIRWAESLRARSYTYVLRTRPDAAYACKLCAPSDVGSWGVARVWGAFARDFAVRKPSAPRVRAS